MLLFIPLKYQGLNQEQLVSVGHEDGAVLAPFGVDKVYGDIAISGNICVLEIGAHHRKR